MNDNILQIGNIIGYILQSFYISYFLLSTKKIKNHRTSVFLLVLSEYIFLKQICNLNYTVNFELMFGILIYLLFKVMYKNKIFITDFITYILSLIILGVASIFISLTVGMNIVGLILSSIIPIIFTYLMRHKLPKIEEFYFKFWNRHKNKKMLKSITIRGFSSVATILTFLFLHLWLIYGIFIVRR